YGGRPLLQMIVALSGIGEQGISRDIAVRPCLIGATPGISRSACAEDIVESNGRVNAATVESGLPGFCDYYVIGQFRPDIDSIDIVAGPVSGFVVGDRVIDEPGSRIADYPIDASAFRGMIAGDQILDYHSIRHKHQPDASPPTADTIPLDDIPF